MNGQSTPTSSSKSQYAFLEGGGEMGALTRAHNWAETPLGPPDQWPLSLRTTVGLVLHSAFPMTLLWGTNLTCFYNDALRPSLGTNGLHPALGKPAKAIWPESWDFIGPLLGQVMTTGKPVFFDDQLVPIYRNGHLEDVYWTFSYNPAYGDDGRAAGVLVICTETTEKVVNARLQQEKSELLQAVLDSSSAGISVVSSVRGEQDQIIDFEYRLVNRVTEQTNNRTDLVGKRYSAIHAGYKQAGIYDDFVQVANTGQPVERERHYIGEGFDNWYETIAVKLDDGVVFSFRDITDMVQARQQREDSERYYRQLNDTVPAVIWETRSDGNCVYLNRQWYDLTGQTPAEAEGFGWLDATHPDDRAESGRLFLEANEAQVPFNAVYRLRHKDGSYRWAIDKGSPRFGADGTYEGMIGTVVDIHDQKMAEENLLASEQRFQAAVAAVQGILWTNNATGQMEGEQPGWAALTGQAYADYQGYGWANAVHPDDAQPTVVAWQEAVARRGTFVFEHRVRMKDGHYEQFSIRAIPLLNADGTIREWVGVHTNVTEQRRAEAALRQSREQQAFLLRLTDQLRPLTDPASIQYQAVCVLGEYVGANRVGYAEDQNDGQHVVVTQNYTNGVPGIEGRYQYNDYGAALMTELQAGRQVVRPDIANDSSLTEAEKEAHALLQLGATVNLPLMKAGRMAGILFLHYNGPHDFSEQELALLNETAERTWEAMERARVAEALRQSEAKLRSLITVAPVAIGLFVGRDLVIDLPNQTFIDIVGKGPDIVGKPLREVMPELITENQPFLQILDDVYTTGQMFQSFGSMVAIVRQGVMTRNYYNITYSPLYNEAGEVYAILDVAVDVTGQILAQQELAQQKSYLQNAIDIADLGTFEIDVATQIAQFSDKLGHWFGLTPLDKPVADFLAKVHTDDQTMVWQALDESMKDESRSRHDITYRIVDADGVTSHHLRSIGKTRYEAGQPTTISGIIQDVTPQVLSRQKIEESEQFARSVIEHSPVAKLVFEGGDMVIRTVNEIMLQLLGRDRSIIGQPFMVAMPELIPTPLMDRLRHVLATGETYYQPEEKIELVHYGQPYTGYYNYVYKALYNAAQERYGIMVTATEVTAQVLARQTVEESEKRFRALLESISQMAWTNTPTGDVDFYNQRWYTYTGLTFEQTRAWGWQAVVHPDDIDLTVANYQHALTTGEEFVVENRYKRADGEYRWHLNRAQPLRSESGQIVQWVGTATDIQEQKELEAELERQVRQRTQQLQDSINDLERSNANLQQFAYVASHDLQEPLRKIQAFGDLLHNQYSNELGEAGRDFLGRMQISANRMSNLIRDLLTYSRISTQQDSNTPVTLDSVVQMALTDLDLIIQETHARVEVAPLPTVQGDKSQLGQLFQNLLNNAIKFRKPDTSPQISITCQRIAATSLPPSVKPTRMAASYYRIAVADDGIGFDEQYTERIFQVFQRLHGKGQYVGTGIGLAICQKVAANHGGAIAASSQSGQGATFSIYLPA
ncbi:PAS domain S-box protein [Fibrella arboris]|uniref:PAS domain S-box protein n=1 Tax=Fibrella arboris TaxID=3242486 RepID=UPI003521F391